MQEFHHGFKPCGFEPCSFAPYGFKPCPNQSRDIHTHTPTSRQAKSCIEECASTKQTTDREANGCCIEYKNGFMYEFGNVHWSSYEYEYDGAHAIIECECAYTSGFGISVYA